MRASRAPAYGLEGGADIVVSGPSRKAGLVVSEEEQGVVWMRKAEQRRMATCAANLWESENGERSLRDLSFTARPPFAQSNAA
jgi:hypothetical protein